MADTEYKLFVRNPADTGWVNALRETNVIIEDPSNYFLGERLDEVLYELRQSIIGDIWEDAEEAQLLVSGLRYFVPSVDIFAVPVTTLTLPLTPIFDDRVTLKDLDGVWGTSPVTLNSNGLSIEGVVQNLILNVTNSSVDLVFTDSQGWKII